MSWWEITVRMFGLVAALALVLFLAWAVMRWMNKRLPGLGGGGGGRLIHVLERMPVGKSGQLLLVRVQDKVLFVAVSEHNAEKLCEFDDPEGLITGPEVMENPSFSEALKDAMGKIGLGNKGGGGKGEGEQ